MTKTLLRTMGAAEELSVSLPTLVRLIRAGRIHVVRIAWAVRIAPTELERLGRVRGRHMRDFSATRRGKSVAWLLGAGGEQEESPGCRAPPGRRALDKGVHPHQP